ncbi:MAG: hypothetical protein EBR02_02020 [Alphaproteobacteria bacterium]|nr:hypothetical protein [Alphaproteobacteria bacterium]
MNKRNLITIVAFLLPVVVVAVLVSSSHSPDSQNTRVAVSSDAIGRLHVERDKVAKRLEQVTKMTQADWVQEGKEIGERIKFRAPTLEEARKRNKDRLEDLDKKIADLEARN